MPKTTDKKKLGFQGEKLARKFLKKLGYRHVTSNYQNQRGEIDLIMRDGPTVVFVEVKTRRDEQFVPSEDVINFHKQRHIEAVAHYFIHTHELHDLPCRFDTVAVVMSDSKKPVIRHQQNAFQPIR